MTLKDVKESVINTQLVFTFYKEGNFVLKVETSGQTFTFKYDKAQSLDSDFLRLLQKLGSL